MNFYSHALLGCTNDDVEASHNYFVLLALHPINVNAPPESQRTVSTVSKTSIQIHDLSGARAQPHYFGGVDDMEKRTEGERYVTITRIDLFVEKACMFLTDVEIDTVKDKKGRHRQERDYIL